MCILLESTCTYLITMHIESGYSLLNINLKRYWLQIKMKNELEPTTHEMQNLLPISIALLSSNSFPQKLINISVSKK